VKPRILALDTTGEFGSLALVEGDGLVEELLLRSPDGFAHILFDHLRRLLDRHGWNISSIDCFAAAAGPGSFTGVRVGLAAAKGLAEACGKPVAAVSNLQALAFFGTGPLRAALIDARRGEIYGAAYDASLEIVTEEAVTPMPRWLATLPRGESEFIASNPAPFLNALPSGRVVHAPAALAGAIGRIAVRRFQEGRALDPALVDANYVRRSDAELYWREA